MQGTVKFYNESKGFGFVITENGDEVFVHITGLIDKISQNDRVEFEIAQGKKGPNAVNVKLI
jgi:CspA family cold shock protein